MPLPEETQKVDDRQIKMAELARLEKEEQLATLESEEAASLQEKKPSQLRKALPFAGEENYERGERSLIGNIFERPGAAVRSGISAAVKNEDGGSRLKAFTEGYSKGANVPEEVDRFQNVFLDKYYENYDFEKRGTIRDAIQIAGGFGISTAGLLADVVTNPADLLLMIGGKMPLPKGTTIGGRIASSSLGRKAGEIASAPVTIENTTKAIRSTANVVGKALKGGMKRLPKIMNEDWFIGQKASGLEVLKSARNLRGKMYELRNPYKGTPVDPNIGKNILMNSTMDTETATVVNRLFGVYDDAGKLTSEGINNIDDVGKLYLLNDVLKMKGGTKFIPRNAAGKGGLANPQIRAVGADKAVKQAIYAEISKTDSAGAEMLAKLDKDAADILYPYIKKMSDIFEATSGTEGVAATYALSGKMFQQGMSKAAHRTAVRKGYKGVSQMTKNYLKGNYKDDLKGFHAITKQLAKDMGAYRKRAAEKAGIISSIAGTGAVLAYKALGRKIGGEGGGR